MAKEIKSAVLHEKFGEHSTLIVVDEDYNIHTLTGDDATFHFLLEGVELPNFIHRRGSADHLWYEVNRHEYRGYYHAEEALNLIRGERERQEVYVDAPPGFPYEVWCRDKHDFTDCTDYEDREVHAHDYPWLEVGKVYPAAYWRDDHSIAKHCYRVRCEDGTEREAPDSYFRVLRHPARSFAA